MHIIPAIDILDSKVVRLSQGDYNKSQIYSDDPVEIALQFSRSGIKRLHVVDLSGAKKNSPAHRKMISEIKRASKCQIQTGGGIRSVSHVESFFVDCLNTNSDHIMIGSLPFKDKNAFKRIVSKYAPNIIVTLDVWRENLKISGWQEDIKKNIFDEIPKLQSEFNMNHFLVTQIERDGLMQGADISLYKKLRKEFPKIELIASGGISSVEDIQELYGSVDIEGVIVGRAFYENRISLRQLQDLKETMQVSMPQR